MAKYINSFYQADNGQVHPIRIRPSTLAAQVDQPPTIATRAEYFHATSKRRGYGNFARGWNLFRTISAGANDNLIRRKFVPCLVENDWKDASRLVNSKITIDGVEWTINSHQPERIR